MDDAGSGKRVDPPRRRNERQWTRISSVSSSVPSMAQEFLKEATRKSNRSRLARNHQLAYLGPIALPTATPLDEIFSSRNVRSCSPVRFLNTLMAWLIS